MLNKAKIENYKNIISFENSKRGDFKNLNYNPTFKSSAIFFVIFDNFINTKVSFFNYWKIKNHNNNVSCQITIRNKSGGRILRKFFKIKLNTYEISIGELLKKNLKIKKFLGSIEIELFSSFDLKYSFPAIDAIYETQHGISLVHSNQRIYDNIQDNLNNESINQTQTGFDIHHDSKNQTFITVINGPLEVKKKKMNINFFNYKGKKLNKSIFYKNLKAYEVIYLPLNNFKKLKFFLDGKRGYCKVDLPTKNIFNRILVGTLSSDKKKITTTHSYYDCSNTRDYINLKKISLDEYACYLPFNLIENVNLEIVIYPIFSKSDLNFSLETFDEKGKRSIIHDSIIKISKNFKDPKIIDINKFITKENNLSKNIYCLNITSKNNLIPSRLTFGFNYKKNSIGSNISESMIVNHGKNSKSKGFYWGPAFNSKKINTILAISSLDKNVKNYSKSSIKLKLYDQNKIILNKKIKINTPQALNINLNKITNKVLGKSKVEKIYWFTLESNIKNILCKHVHISRYGHISADHNF